MSRLVGVALTGLIITSAFSAPLHRYVALTPRMFALAVEPYNSPHSDMRSSTTMYSGQGVQAECGFTRGDFTLYTGLNFDYAHKYDRHDYSYGSSSGSNEQRWKWYLARMALGVRLHAAMENPNRLYPWFGVRGTYGWLKRTYQEDHFQQIGGQTFGGSEHVSQSSPGTLGYGFDLGFVVTTHSPLAVQFAVSYDNLGTDLNHDSSYWLEHVTGISELAVQLGLRYHIDPLGASSQ